MTGKIMIRKQPLLPLLRSKKKRSRSSHFLLNYTAYSFFVFPTSQSEVFLRLLSLQMVGNFSLNFTCSGHYTYRQTKKGTKLSLSIYIYMYIYKPAYLSIQLSTSSLLRNWNLLRWQKIPAFLVCSLPHLQQPAVTSLSQMNPVHNLQSYSVKTCLNIAISSILRCPNSVISSGLPTKTSFYLSPTNYNFK